MRTWPTHTQTQIHGFQPPRPQSSHDRHAGQLPRPADSAARAAGRDYTSGEVAAYLRVSTDEQARSGLGLANQLHRCAAMAIVKGWPEPAVYADEGLSGIKGPEGRPGLKHLLTDVAAGHVRVVIVTELSRLGRRTRLVLDLVDELGASGAHLVSCKEALDTTTPQGTFALTLFAALAQLERDQTVDRTIGALDARSRTVGFKGGQLPYGYRHELGSDEVVVDAEEAAVVEHIFRLAHRETWSLRAIAAHLNERGVASPRGKRWYHPAIREILDNVGVYQGDPMGASSRRWAVILPRSLAASPRRVE